MWSSSPSTLIACVVGALLAGLPLSASHVIRHPHNSANGSPVSSLSSPAIPAALEQRQNDDPRSFGWVRRMAAPGDSYTSGVGSGSRLGFAWHNFNDWVCSRYDQSYPMLFYNYLGSNVENFQYPACFGDQTWQVYNQITKLEGDLDLVTLTAGGNDLCLSDIIKDCIALAFKGEATCNAILDKAEENLKNIMRKNIKELLLALKPKVNKDGIVVYNGYARFFNEENEDCATKHDWGFFRWVSYIWDVRSEPLPLTVDRRKRFNKLTKDLNDLIRDVVKDVKDEVDFKVGFSDWDLWAIEAVKGQFCDPVSSGRYPDPKQPDLIFFKMDTRKTIFKWPIKKREMSINGTETIGAGSGNADEDEDAGELHEGDKLLQGPLDEDDLKALRASIPPPPKRDLDSKGVDRTVYRSSLWNSVNPRAAALKKLDRRAPDTPGCPGDPWPILPNLGPFTPDFFGRIFHPNELGHNAIASFAIGKAIDLRAEVLGVKSEVCKVTDEFKCWQKDGRRAYASADRLDKHYEKFCDDLKPPTGVNQWRRSQKFDEGTPEEHEFAVELGEDASDFNRAECKESLKRVIHSCDGNDPNNPMNWKFGGKWKRNQYTYEVNIKRDNRPWPPIKAAYGSCHGKYKFLFSDFKIYGAGWAGWDHGQETLLKKSKDCLGLGVTKWEFKYFDQPDENGMEWESTFRTPVFVSNRCYRNNKVAFGAGGFTDGCGGDSGA